MFEKLIRRGPAPRRSGRVSTAQIGRMVAALLIAVAVFQAFNWTVNRVYVEPGKSLVLRYKGPLLIGLRKAAVPGHFAKVDPKNPDRPLEIGILEQLRGPGRHFFCPIWWERTIEEDMVIEPGEVGIVTSKFGENLPGDQFLVDGELDGTQYKGILRKAFGPGRYRYNPYGYEFKVVKDERHTANSQEKVSGWVSVPTGYVGVVTNLTDIPDLEKAGQFLQRAGIQSKVLQPGLYPVNPRAQQIDIVEVGYREKSMEARRKLDRSGNVALDESGEPAIDLDTGGIEFPSSDGFPIHIDFTAIWGIMPDQAADTVRRFGSIQAVEDKVIVPQIESICRIRGSQMGAVDLLVGDSRRKFQEEASLAFQTALKEKHITLLYGLIRYISIPKEVRLPIQLANLSDELKLTRDQEQLTAKTEAKLREAERRVELESSRIKVETERKVANVAAEGLKKSEETKAETVQRIAAVDRQTAELEAAATVVRGEATSGAEKLMQEAKSQKFQLAVQAFGSGLAFNQWVFATGLPEDIKLNMLYAGQGTFWTDLKGFNEVLLGRQAQQQMQSGGAAEAAPAATPNRR